MSKKPSIEKVSALDPAADRHNFDKLDLAPYATTARAAIEFDFNPSAFLEHVVSAENPVAAVQSLLSGYDLDSDYAKDMLSYLLHGGYSDLQVRQERGHYVNYVESPVQAMFNLPERRHEALKFLATLEPKTQALLLSRTRLGVNSIVATLTPDELALVSIDVTVAAVADYLTQLFPTRNYSTGRNTHPTKLIDECERFMALLSPEVFAHVLSPTHNDIKMSILPETPVWIQMFNYRGEAQDLAVRSINHLLRTAPDEGLRVLFEGRKNYLGDGFAVITKDRDYDRKPSHTHLAALFEGVEDGVVITALQQSMRDGAANDAEGLDLALQAQTRHMQNWIAGGMPDSLFQTLFFTNGDPAQSIKPILRASYFSYYAFHDKGTPLSHRTAKFILDSENRYQVLHELALNDPETFGILVTDSRYSELNVTTILRDEDDTLSLEKALDTLTRPELADVMLSVDCDRLMAALTELCTDAESARRLHFFVAGLFRRPVDTQHLMTRDIPAIHLFRKSGGEKGELHPSVVKFFATVQEWLPEVVPVLDEHISELETAFYRTLTDLDVVWGVYGESAHSLIANSRPVHALIEPFVYRMFSNDNPLGPRRGSFRPSRVAINFIKKLCNPDDGHYEDVVGVVIDALQKQARTYNASEVDLKKAESVGVMEAQIINILLADVSNEPFKALAMLGYIEGKVQTNKVKRADFKQALTQLALTDWQTLELLFAAYAEIKDGNSLSPEVWWVYNNFYELVSAAVGIDLPDRED